MISFLFLNFSIVSRKIAINPSFTNSFANLSSSFFSNSLEWYIAKWIKSELLDKINDFKNRGRL